MATTAPQDREGDGTPGAAPRRGQDQDAADTARTAGRGGVAVLGAKVFFIVVGFIQQPLLKLVVGLADFGGLAQALVVSNTVNNVVVASATQGVSRAVAGAPGREEQVLRVALRVHVPLALGIALLTALAAPLYASFEGASDVVPPLLVLAGVALFYGLYAPLVGYINGRKRFTTQAGLDVTFAALRTIGLVGVGYLFVKRGQSGVLGTTVGWVVAAACIVPLALRATGIGKPREAAAQDRGVPTARAYLWILLPIAGVQLCTNLLMQIDIALLGRFLAHGAHGAIGIIDEASARRDAVKQWVAIYKECQTFAFLPYQLLFSITLVLFPMLARAKAEGDDAAVRNYVVRGSRLGGIACGLLVGVVVAMPESLLSFAYGRADAARGADTLRMLALGQASFAMLGIATTILTSLGRERISALLTLGAVAVVATSCWALASGADFGHAQLLRTATATAIALSASIAVAGMVVRAQTGGFVPLLTMLRVGVALGACIALGFFMPCVGKLVTPLVAVAVAVAYVAILVGLREITGEDLGALKAMRGKKRARP